MLSKNNSKATNSEKIDIYEQIEYSVLSLIRQLEFINNQFRDLYTKYGVNKPITKSFDSDFGGERERLINSDGYKYARELTELIRNNFRKIKDSALGLSELLEDNKKEFYQNKIKSIDIEKIQKKKYISVKEFTEIYGKSSDWQKDRRGRLRNKLPFIQEKLGSNILYKVEDIEIWFENNSINLKR